MLKLNALVDTAQVRVALRQRCNELHCMARASAVYPHTQNGGTGPGQYPDKSGIGEDGEPSAGQLLN